jgi:hypothetical protein
MRAAAIQLAPVIVDVAANLDACESLADAAAAQGADWIVLPQCRDRDTETSRRPSPRGAWPDRATAR